MATAIARNQTGHEADEGSLDCSDRASDEPCRCCSTGIVWSKGYCIDYGTYRLLVTTAWTPLLLDTAHVQIATATAV